ncbi:TonB family protein [uncultured Umboniibacter sp.]|uniref:TonB family protein n=1 Tax=uncultured Umboniibacter sp. TaxID=1798917 RepID=UPI002607BB75|nr:TonB family protein [uncultured Umboniibacter sp.]
MKKFINGALVALCLVSLSSFSQADFATENNLVLNGVAIHQELRQPIFLAKLKVTHPTSTPNEARIPGAPAQMELTLLKRTWSSRQFRQYWLSGIAINAGLEEMTAHQTELLDLATVLKGRMRENDRFTIDFIPGEATVVSLNDIELKQYSAELWPLLIANWVGPRVDQDYRQNILSLPSNTSELLALDTEMPSDERIAAIASWLVVAEEIEVAAEELVPEVEPEPVVEVVAAPVRQPEPEPEPEPVVVALSFDDEFEEDESAEEAALEAQKAFMGAVYSSQMLQWTNRNVRYPSRALDRGREGRVIMDVTVDQAGNVVSAVVSESSGHGILDREALRAVDRSAPYPRFPSELDTSTYTASVPISFILQ